MAVNKDSVRLIYPQGLSPARQASLLKGQPNQPPQMDREALEMTMNGLAKSNIPYYVEFDKKGQAIFSPEGSNTFNLPVKGRSNTYGSTGIGKQNTKVAVIPIVGSMSKYGHIDWWAFEYVRGTQSVISEIAQAANEEDVKAIVLYIDSPGGDVDGTHELAQAVAKAGKPVFAAVCGMACSAAYWVASQCQQVYCTSPQTEVGSIGVYVMHVDQSAFLEELGFKVTFVTDDNSPDKIVAPFSEPLSDEDRQKLVNMINPIKSDFVAAVKQGRGDKLSNENPEIFQGKVFKGSSAKSLGLMDGIMLFDQIVLEAHREGGRQDRQARGVGKSENIFNNENNINMSFLNSVFPGKHADLTISEPVTLTAAEAEAIRQGVAELKTENAELKGKLETASGEAGSSKSQVSDLTSQITALQQQLSEAQGKVSGFETKVTELETQIAAKGQEVETLGKDLATEKAAHETLKVDYDKLMKNAGKSRPSEKASQGDDPVRRTDVHAGKPLV